jgi:aminopeptidase N
VNRLVVLPFAALPFLAAAVSCAGSPAPRLAAPQPRSALEPQALLDAEHYAIDLEPRLESGTVDLRVEIDAVTLRATNELALHFSGPDPRLVRVNGESVRPVRDGDLLRMPLAVGLAEGCPVKLEVAYEGIPGKGMSFSTAAGAPPGLPARTLHTDSWPDWARTWLPCVDHPADRASVSVRIRLSSSPDLPYQAVANGAWRSGSLDGSSLWEEDVPIPTYLIAVAVGPYRWIGPPERPEIRHFVYAWCEEAARKDLAEVPAMVEFFERRLCPYPYAKVSIVQTPTRFGGMENAGCIFVREAAIDGSGRVAGTLAHELAHQWFGDLVGIASWEDLWLSEGFATYLGTLYMEEGRPGGDLARAMGAMQAALLQDPLLREKPIVGPLPSDLDALLNPLNYQKGACVLHALRRHVGETAFWKGLRAHLERGAGRAVRTADLVAAMSDEAGQDLSGFFEAWVRRAGAPKVRVRLLEEAAKGTRVCVEQVQEGPVFPCTLDVEVISGGRRARGEVRFESSREATASFPGLTADEVIVDPDRWVLHQIDAPAPPRE